MSAAVANAAISDHCTYCDAPLLSAALCGKAGWDGAIKRYCCYGCRVLGENGRKPVLGSTSHSSPWFKVGVGAAIAGQAMALGFAVNLARPEAAVRWLLHGALVFSAGRVFSGLPRPLLRPAVVAPRRTRGRHTLS